MRNSFFLICLMSGSGLCALRHSNSSRVNNFKSSPPSLDARSPEAFWCAFVKEAREAINSASTACELLLLERRYGLLIVGASDAEFRKELFNVDQQKILMRIKEIKDFYSDCAVQLSLLLNVYIRKISSFGNRQKKFHKQESETYKILREK